MVKLAGATVVITGAGRGIGHAIAEELGFHEAKIVVNYAHSKGPAEELVESRSQGFKISIDRVPRAWSKWHSTKRQSPRVPHPGAER